LLKVTTIEDRDFVDERMAISFIRLVGIIHPKGIDVNCMKSIQIIFCLNKNHYYLIECIYFFEKESI